MSIQEGILKKNILHFSTVEAYHDVQRQHFQYPGVLKDCCMGGRRNKRLWHFDFFA